jgi:LmbE family N-acetylglucosaminyl deacetylase
MARILTVVAHPDDAELSCWGSLLAWRDMGADLSLVVVSSGEQGARLGPPGEALARQREQEACRSAASLGVTPHFLRQPDGKVQLDAAWLDMLADVARQFAPDLMVTHAPRDYHPDHRTVSLGVSQVASFKAPVIWFDTLAGTGFEPTAYIDISPHMSAKIHALRQHTSQEPERFVQAMQQQNAWRARQCNAPEGCFAEAWRFEASYPFCDVRALLAPPPALKPLGKN